MKPRILVLEDDRTSRKLLVNILEKSGYNALECGEGKDAIHIATMNPPHVLVVDVMLPDMSGTEVVQELTQKPACRFMKVIFLTGLLTKKAKESSDGNYLFDVDGVHYKALAKPVRKKKLIELLSQGIRDSVAAEEAEIAAKKLEKEKALAEHEEKLAALKSSKENDGDEPDEPEEPDLGEGEEVEVGRAAE